MESSVLTAVLLPLALFVIMLGMGLGLKPADFGRIWLYPKAVVIGLVAQLLIVPLVGFGLASLWPLTPELAVGVVLLAVCPGGATSNVVTYLARGNVALSITLTALSSLVTVLTIPIAINLATATFMATSTDLQLPLVSTMIQIAVITLIPISLGMAIYRYAPRWAQRAEAAVKWLSLLFLVLIIVGLLVQQRANVVDYVAQVGAVTLTLNLITMALGFGLATGLGLDRPSVKAITVEVGIQNGTLAIAIASLPTLLNQPMLAIPAAIYSLVMFATSGLFVAWSLRRA